MASAGGVAYKGMGPKDWERLEQAQKLDRERLHAQVDEFLAQELTAANDRDVAAVKARLEEIKQILGERVQVEQVMYGGSIAKRTAVEGVSDVDALVVLDRADALESTPVEFLRQFAKELRAQLSSHDVQTVTPGTLAVTVTFHDGMEIQLLPATRKGEEVMIGKADGAGWRVTEPKVFRDALSSANAQTGGQLIRVVKLYKLVNDRLPAQKQLSGYHIEALALEVFRAQEGAAALRDMLLRFLEASAHRVLARIPDMTGQSRYVDEYLKEDGSIERRNIAQTLLGLRRRLDAATSKGEWKTVFGD